MENKLDLLNYSLNFKDTYIKNNSKLSGEDITNDVIFECVCEDVDFVLKNLGVSPSKIGYCYWKEAAYIYILSGKMHMSICNEVYPLIAEKHGKTAMSIERAMRICFENSLYYSSKHGYNFVTDYFKNYLLNPHNGKIIIKLVEIITSSDFQKYKQKHLDSFNI